MHHWDSAENVRPVQGWRVHTNILPYKQFTDRTKGRKGTSLRWQWVIKRALICIFGHDRFSGSP